MDDAEKIPVKVGGKVFQTYLDASGVQRFVSNSVINQILAWEWDDFRVKSSDAILNKLACGYIEGKYSEEDMLDFYTFIGYSVSGFCDLSYFSHLPIENPLWN